MKTRNGFVTNSSSSLFIVRVNQWRDEDEKWDLQDVKEVLQIMLDSYNAIYNSDLKFDNVFTYVAGSKDDDKALREAFDDCCWDADAKYDVYDEVFYENFDTDKTYMDIVKTGEFVILSGNNTIPYQLFDYIRKVLNANRLHLG